MPYRQTKAERKAWWNSLSQEEKSSYTEKWESKRDVADRKRLDIPPLTNEEMQAINDRMRRLGLESFIVLPDINTEESYQEQLAAELQWINQE